MSNPDEPMTLTLKDAAALAGLDYRTIKAGVDRGTIPALHFGSRVMIPRAAFLRLLQTGDVTP